MNFFARLGAHIEARFREYNFDEARFPEVALAALKEMPLQPPSAARAAAAPGSGAGATAAGALGVTLG